MIIVVGGEKGGTGKTTIALTLAITYLIQNTTPNRVACDMPPKLLLVDADPQKSATEFCSLREEEEILPHVRVIQLSGERIAKTLKAIEETNEIIIIDTGAKDSVELRASLLVADKFIIPLKPSQLDLWTLAKMERLINDCKIVNPGLRSYLCINQADTHRSQIDLISARTFLTDAKFDNLTLIDNFAIHERAIFRRTICAGKTVADLSPHVVLSESNRLAKAEMHLLYLLIFEDKIYYVE